ncbi:uncharacterized protein [Danio rerio]|uniref:Uncharacterized protein n=1 Tax=Danio rerio TaxID=7955 RepID=A0AC58HKW1_DANRE
MWFRNALSRVLPRPKERREVSSYTKLMASCVKNTTYPSESDLKACFDPSSSVLPNLGSTTAKKGKHSPLQQSPIPVLKPNRVPVEPVNQQSFTDGPPEQLGESSKVRVQNIIFPCEFESNASVKRSSSPLSHSGSGEVMTEKIFAVRKNLVLKPHRMPVKPVNKQNFTDGYPKQQGVSSKVSVKNIIFQCESELNGSVNRSSTLLEPNHVPVVPIDGQRFTYGPPKYQGVSSPKHKTEVSVKNISFPSCESGVIPRVEISPPVLPLLKPSCAPVKRLAGQKSIDGPPASRFPDQLLNETERNVVKASPLRQDAPAAPAHLPSLKPNRAPVKPVEGQKKPTGRFLLTKTGKKISESCGRSPEHGGVKSPRNLLEVSAEANKCQNPVAVPIHLPALKPGRTLVKPSARQKFTDRSSGHQVSRFSTFVNIEAHRNGSDPEVKTHISLPRLPGFPKGPVKKRVAGAETKNLMLSQTDDEDVKMKRPQSAKSNRLPLSRICLGFTEHPHENKSETCL